MNCSKRARRGSTAGNCRPCVQFLSRPRAAREQAHRGRQQSRPCTCDQANPSNARGDLRQNGLRQNGYGTRRGRVLPTSPPLPPIPPHCISSPPLPVPCVSFANPVKHAMATQASAKPPARFRWLPDSRLSPVCTGARVHVGTPWSASEERLPDEPRLTNCGLALGAFVATPLDRRVRAHRDPAVV